MKITRKMYGLCLVALFAASIMTIQGTTAAFAQEDGDRPERRGRGRGRGMARLAGKSVLLTSAQVRGELKVTEDQGKTIDEILASYREEARSLWRGGRGRGDSDSSDGDRENRRKEMRKKFAELRKTIESKISSTLDDAQNTRLNQISLQHRGVDALNAKHVATALALTDDQRAKIKDALSSMNEEMRSLRGGRRGPRGGGGGGDDGDREARREAREKARAKIEELRNSTQTTVMAVLTEEQVKKFEELKGAPFDLDRKSLWGGRGGRDRDGRGRGGEGGKDGKKRKRPDVDDAI